MPINVLTYCRHLRVKYLGIVLMSCNDPMLELGANIVHSQVLPTRTLRGYVARV